MLLLVQFMIVTFLVVESVVNELAEKIRLKFHSHSH